MCSISNIIKIKTSAGTLHYYQVLANETIKDLISYFTKIYQNEKSIVFKYNKEKVDENVLLSEYIGRDSILDCEMPVRSSIITKNKPIKPQQYGFNLKPDPCEIDLPPRPELQDDSHTK